MKAALVLAFSALAAATQTPGQQFITGLLLTVEPSIGGHAAACVQDTVPTYFDVQNGINLLVQGVENKNISAVLAGAADLELAVALLARAEGACNEPEAAQKLIALLKAFEQDPLGTLAGFMPFWGRIQTDISTLQSDYAAGNFTGAGQSFGDIIVIALTNQAAGGASQLIFKMAAAAAPTSSNPAAEQFLNGILEGLGTAFPTNNTKPCIMDADSCWSDVNAGINDLKNALQNKNLTALLLAYTDFEGALVVIQQAAADCGSARLAAALAKLIQEIKTDPLEVALSLAPYFFTIVGDAQAAVSDFEAMQFEASGQDIGKVLAILLTDGQH